MKSVTEDRSMHETPNTEMKETNSWGWKGVQCDNGRAVVKSERDRE